MKKIILILISFFAVCSFTACVEPEEPLITNENVIKEEEPPVLEEENISLSGDWECFLPRSNDNIVITLTFDTSKNRFYTVQTPFIQGFVLFGNEQWRTYDLQDDTMYLEVNGEISYNPSSAKFIITYHSQDVMEMRYGGVMPAIPIKLNYIFNRKKNN